jgi:integrase
LAVPFAISWHIGRAPTAAAEKFRLGAVERVLGSDKRLEAITAADLRHYQMARLAQGRKPATINGEVRCLRQILKWAHCWNQLRDGYHQLSVPKESPRKPLTIAEFNHLVRTAIRTPDWQVALCVAVLSAETAARSYELKNLRLADLVLAGDEIFTEPHLRIRREGTKTDAGVRRLPLNRAALWAVNVLLARAAALGANAPEHYLLPADLSRHTRHSDPLHGYCGFDPARHQESWRSAWRSLVSAAKMRGVHFHDLRHTSITEGRKQGVAMDVMRRLAGHMSVAMTEYYTHLGGNDLVSAVQMIEAGNPELLRLLEIGATKCA